MLITINKRNWIEYRVQMTHLCYGLHRSKSAVLFFQHIQLFQFRLNMWMIKKPIPLQWTLEARSEKQNNYKHNETRPSVASLVSTAQRRPHKQSKETTTLCNFRWCYGQSTKCTTDPPVLGTSHSARLRWERILQSLSSLWTQCGKKPSLLSY